MPGRDQLGPNAGRVSGRVADLEDVTPILSLVVEPLVHHFHNLDEIAPAPRSVMLALDEQVPRLTDYMSSEQPHSSEYPKDPMDRSRLHLVLSTVLQSVPTLSLYLWPGRLT